MILVNHYVMPYYQQVEKVISNSWLFRNKNVSIISEMNQYERSFIFMAIALHIGIFLNVGYTSRKWGEITFIFAYAACLLTFAQFFIRYIAVTHLYKTETSISAWVISFLIITVSSISIYLTENLPYWFLSFSAVLFLANLKTSQSIRKILGNKKINKTHVLRLSEYRVFEFGFGLFVLLFFLLSVTNLKDFIGTNNQAICLFGTLAALFYSLISMSMNIVRVTRSKTIIEAHLKN